MKGPNLGERNNSSSVVCFSIALSRRTCYEVCGRDLPDVSRSDPGISSGSGQKRFGIRSGHLFRCGRDEKWEIVLSLGGLRGGLPGTHVGPFG